MRIGVLGAGSIGAYLGGRLALAGADVTLVGRAAFGEAIRACGLRLTDYAGADVRVSADRLPFATGPAALAACDVVLVTVKSGATGEAASALAPHLQAGATVVSFQNGVRNAPLLRQRLPGAMVLAGVVPWNVARQGPAHLHRGTAGVLAIEDAPGAAAIVAAIRAAGLEIAAHRNIDAVQWGKLVVNLNNAINALAGVPLRDELLDRGYRRVLAGCIREAVAVLERAGIRPARATPLPARALAAVLALPDFLFRRVAASMLRVDARARSSMWDDLEARRPTEIDVLNGEIVALATGLGIDAPRNRRVVALVHEAERAGAGSPRLSAASLQREIDGDGAVIR
jgi:2-dehydropantoate 2-reductase